MSAGSDQMDGFHMAQMAASAIVEFCQDEMGKLEVEELDGPTSGYPTKRNAAAGVCRIVDAKGETVFIVAVSETGPPSEGDS